MSDNDVEFVDSQQQQEEVPQLPDEIESERWVDLDKLFNRTSGCVGKNFQISPELKQFVQNETQILVIGAGGLGCEILKNLALSGFKNISVIDMDTIDLSNLNRQFLFREKDIGKSKAETAAKFVMDRVPGCNVTAYHAKIQDFDEEFYSGFNVVISGLDAIEPRRWLNNMLCSLVQYQDDSDEIDPSTVVPMIDGGTEGFKGQARVIFPKSNACFECTLDLFPPQVAFPECTIAFTPRLPEHCVAYAKSKLWRDAFGDKKVDGDNPEHIEWLYQAALKRAEQFNIPGVTYRLTQGVVKNIIPAIASTNAIISAACCNEAWKLLTSASKTIEDYMMYNGNESIYTYTYQNQRKDDCPVCGMAKPRPIRMERTSKLQDVLDYLKDNFTLNKPGIRTEDNRTLYMTAPLALQEATKKNLPLSLSEDLKLADGTMLTVTDAALGQRVLQFFIQYTTDTEASNS